MIRCLSALCILFFSLFLIAGEKDGWSDKAELSGVFTSGNSESSTLGLSNKLGWKGGPSTFDFDISVVRAESEDAETGVSEITAENYVLFLRYSQKFSERTDWYVGGDWRKDEIAGIKSRSGFGAGIGNTWVDADTRKFKTSYGLKMVQQEDVFEPMNFDDSHVALNLRMEHFQTVTKTANYEQTLAVDINGEETDEYTANWEHGFSVSVSKRIALKVGLKLLYDNEPSFKSPGVQLDDLDTIFTTSLVVNF